MDIEQTMRFILDMQAKHEDMQAKHEAWLQAHEEAVRKHDEQIRVLLDATLSLVHHGEETDRRIRELSEETNRRFQDTDYKLNALIDAVDKLVKRNGSRE